MILLIMIYSSLALDIERHPTMKSCMEASKAKIGQELPINSIDPGFYSPPLQNPKVMVAFCTKGTMVKNLNK